MGTNYYAFTKNKELVKKHFMKNEWERDCELVDEPDLGYEIHLGKRSMGWKPLFQEHKNAYTSVNGMLNFFKEHGEDFKFFNEYSEEKTLDQIKEELVDWANIPEDRIQHCKKVFNGKRYDLKDVSPGEPYDIATPFSHIKYMEVMNEPYYRDRYWEDEDGYDFTEGDFA